MPNIQPKDTNLDQSDFKKRRRAERIATRLPAAVARLTDKGMSPPKSAEVRDISSYGLSVAVQEPLAVDSLFVVQLAIGKRQKPAAPLVCRAVHVKNCIGKTWLIGAEFVGRLPENFQAAANPAAAEMERIRNSILK